MVDHSPKQNRDVVPDPGPLVAQSDMPLLRHKSPTMRCCVGACHLEELALGFPLGTEYTAAHAKRVCCLPSKTAFTMSWAQRSTFGGSPRDAFRHSPEARCAKVRTYGVRDQSETHEGRSPSPLSRPTPALHKMLGVESVERLNLVALT
jgi:hypothetical protein